MKKISQAYHGGNSQLFGNPNAPFQWFLFGYCQNGAVVIYLWRKPSWLARLCCKLMLKSDFFEVNSDPSFAVENINVNNDVTLLSVVDDSNCEVKPH